MQKVKTSQKIQKDRKGAIEIKLWEPSMLNWRDVFADYMWVLRNRVDNKLSMFKVQIEIYQDLVLSQKNIQMCRDIRKTPSNIKNYTKSNINVDPVDIDKRIKKEKVFIKSLKEIMDGHLWRLFNYNRALMQEIGRQPGTTFISIDEGGFKEVYAWANQILETDNTHFLLNGLTNASKIGDVIVKNNKGEIELLEIKSSKLASGKKQKERLLRQQERRANFESLANTKKGLIDGIDGEIVELPIKYSDDFCKLRHLLKKADQNGISNLKVKDYLFMTCVDLSIKVEEQKIKKYLSEHRTIKSKKDDIIIMIDTSTRDTFSTNFVPLSIFPIPELFIADLMLGKKQIFYSINITKILKTFEKHGWSIKSTFYQSPDNKKVEDTPFCTINKNKINIDVPWTIPNQLIFELQDSCTICEVLNFSAEEMKNESKRGLYNYSNEADIWS